MVSACATDNASLSPALWPAADRARLENAELALGPAAARTVEGEGLVVGSMSPIAVHAGAEALRKGGSAADAALTTALTQIATNAGSVVSYAGVMQLVYFEAATGKVHALDAGWQAWTGETSPATIPASDLSLVTGAAGGGASGRQTLVPGFVAGVEATHQRFGKLPFASLFEPAIWLAREGIEVSPLLGVYFGMRAPLFAKTEGGRTFLGGSAAPATGAVFKQRDLAETLEAVARDGSAFMYSGAWAANFVVAVNAAGGVATMDDLARYKPVWSEPASTQAFGAVIHGPATTNVTGCQILEALNLLDARGASGGAYWRDPATFLELSRVLRFVSVGHYLPQVAAAERRNGLASTCAARLSPGYAKAMAPEVDTLSGAAPGQAAGHHSASVVAIDREGNVAALVHSGNSAVWGDLGIVFRGIPLPNAGGIYQSRIAATGPGGRVASDMAPVIAMKGGRPHFAIATIGSSLTPETLRLAHGLLRSVDPAELAGAPPLLINADAFAMDIAARPDAIPAGRYSEAFRDSLKSLGLAAREEPPQRVLALKGTAAMAIIGETSSAPEDPAIPVYAEAQ